MSEASEKARSAAKDKAKRLTEVPASSVDASGWTEAPCGFMHTEKKLGNRPISKQNLKTGGRAALKHGGRKGRDMGGPTANGQPMVASVPLPPQNRFSFTGQPSPFLGAAGMKKGGGIHIKKSHEGLLHKELGVAEGKKIPAKKLEKGANSSNAAERKRAVFAENAKKWNHRASGGPVKEDSNKAFHDYWNNSASASVANSRKTGKSLAQEYPDKNAKVPEWSQTRKSPSSIVPRKDGGGVQNPEIIGNRPVGGRIPRKDGGSTKGKTNINIIIAQKPDKPQMPMGGPPIGAPPPARPMPMPPPGAAPPGPQGMPAGPMPGGPNMPPPSMARASGGRTYPIKDGSGGGKGRLEKIKAYGPK